MKKRTSRIICLCISIFMTIITALIVIYTFILVGGANSGFTIQDVYNYCCKNPEVEITIHGDNCTNVINNIYGGSCN